jgi:uncharacterized membrane protein
MPDTSPPQTPDVPPPAAGEPPGATAALIVYGLYALSGVIALGSAGVHAAPLLSTIGLIGLIIAYVKRGDAQGSWTHSHLAYLIRTFWWALGASLIGWLCALTLILLPIGWLIWLGAAVWILYRVIRGYLYFKDGKALPMN